jgi:hypothetical protein
MHVSSAITGFLNYVKDVTLDHFEIIDIFVYDENLDFRGRASQFIAREGIFQKFEGEDPKDWIFIIWNRGSLQPNDTSHSRIMDVTMGLNDSDVIDSEVRMRMVKLDIELKIVTNNIDIAETLEEWLHIRSGELLTFSADYGTEFGIMECSAEADMSTTFEKEDINELGSLMSVGTTATISFPIFLVPNEAKIIKHIHNKIYDSVSINYDAQVLSDEWIPDAP